MLPRQRARHHGARSSGATTLKFVELSRGPQWASVRDARRLTCEEASKPLTDRVAVLGVAPGSRSLIPRLCRAVEDAVAPLLRSRFSLPGTQ